jgi:hypothetical protein
MTLDTHRSNTRPEPPAADQPSAGAIGELVDAVRALGDRARFLAVNLAVIAAKLKQQGVGRTRLNDDILDLVARVTRVSQDVAESVSAIERGRSAANASAHLPHTQWEQIGVPDERTLDRLTRSLQETLELSRHVFRLVRDTYPSAAPADPTQDKPGLTWAEGTLDTTSDSTP